MKHLKPLFALAIVIFALIGLFSGGPIEQPPGALAPDEPVQKEPDQQSQITSGKFALTPRARYSLKVRVLSVERYHTDAGASLAPVDFAVGWGPMSDTSVIEHFRITQGARFYTIYPDDDAIDIGTALRSSANMHLIPADGAVRDALFRTRPGNIVVLNGILVGASRSDGFTWNTSLTRTDTGNGACELMYVQSAVIQ